MHCVCHQEERRDECVRVVACFERDLNLTFTGNPALTCGFMSSEISCVWGSVIRNVLTSLII